MKQSILKCAIVCAAVAAASAMPSPGFSQTRAPAQQWWTYKTQPGIYTPPNKPFWSLAELKKQHAGQADWQQLIISNPDQQATYNSAAPGTKFGQRMNTDTNTLFVVMAGEMHFMVEGQPPVTATRGSIVNILHTTIHSWEIAGSDNALWIEIHPTGTNTVYPADDAQPAPKPGAQIVKVAFTHTPGVYTAPNELHWNFFAAVAACAPLGVHVNEEHQYASALAGYANPNDPDAGKCKGPVGPPNPAMTPFDPKGVFGHLHSGKMEWWIIQSGHMDGRIEATGEFHASEGDVMAAPVSTWHSMIFEGPGLSERLAITPFPFNNENNTAGE